MQIVLGSSSKFRKKVFSQVSPEFLAISPEIDEKEIRDDDPKKLTLMIAKAKAEALLPRIADSSILVTADQVVLLGGAIREKPESEEECRQFLRSYSSAPVEVVNGVVVMNTGTGETLEGLDIVRLKFKEIPEDLIDQFIREGDVMYCAGGLKAEHPALQEYIETKEGTDESLQGVPVELIRSMIEKLA